MKILMATPYFYPRIGGAENYVYNISKFMVKEFGFEVCVVCSNWERGEAKEETIDGIKVYRLPFLFKYSYTPVNPVWQRVIEAIIKREKPDVVNGHTPVPYMADMAARASYRTGVPFVLTCHDIIAQSGLYSVLSAIYFMAFGNRTFKLTSQFIANSPQTAEKFGGLKRKYGDKLTIVPPGVDSAVFHPQKKTPSYDKVILFAAQLYKPARKGLDVLIKAMPQVLKEVSDVRLQVLGPGPQESYQQLAASLGVAENISFLGGVETALMPDYYNKADVFVLPSCKKLEGFGMTLLEAQACQRPVVGTKVGGIPSAVLDGETGLLVPSGEAEPLAEAIIRLLSDEKLAAKLAANGHRRAKAEFSWQKITAATVEVYKKALGDKT